MCRGEEEMASQAELWETLLLKEGGNEQLRTLSLPTCDLRALDHTQKFSKLS